jgi:hypothetical protein
MKLNKYALVLFLGLGTLTSCNDNLELLNPNQQTHSVSMPMIWKRALLPPITISVWKVLTPV